MLGAIPYAAEVNLPKARIFREMSNAVGGVKLHVKASHVLRAEELL